ncbi:MAG: class I SAM-dependent methyltransferase [Candidatus Acidiferrales bacterium]
MTTEKGKPFARLVRALPGTHERVVETALRYTSPGARALELGAGSGALAERLQAAGFSVTAADVENYFELGTEFLQLDLNDPNFERALSSEFDLITAVEVIEHLENPTAFLRSLRKLLKPDGAAILTTPNVENVPARLKFLMRGEVRAMDKCAPEHITPIHLDLFVRKIVPPSGLALVEHFVYPKNDFPLTARRYFVPFFRLLALVMKGPALTGDCHFLVLKRAEAQKSALRGRGAG